MTTPANVWRCPNLKCAWTGTNVHLGFGGKPDCPRCRTFVVRVRGAKDPNSRLARKMKQAYRSTDQYKVDKLMAEQSRWLRKQTIATNKLAAVRKAIDQLLAELAAPIPRLAVKPPEPPPEGQP